MSPEKTSKLSEISCDAPPKARFNSINNPIGISVIRYRIPSTIFVLAKPKRIGNV
jgi:hypothetical protein